MSSAGGQPKVDSMETTLALGVGFADTFIAPSRRPWFPRKRGGHLFDMELRFLKPRNELRHRRYSSFMGIASTFRFRPDNQICPFFFASSR